MIFPRLLTGDGYFTASYDVFEIRFGELQRLELFFYVVFIFLLVHIRFFVILAAWNGLRERNPDDSLYILRDLVSVDVIHPSMSGTKGTRWCSVF